MIEELPNGVPGEIRLSVSLAEASPGGVLPAAVRDRIEELRPAGIRVLADMAGSVTLQARVQQQAAANALDAIGRPRA